MERERSHAIPGLHQDTPVLECQRGAPRPAALSRGCQGEQDQGGAENPRGGAEPPSWRPRSKPLEKVMEAENEGLRRLASSLGGNWEG